MKMAKEKSEEEKLLARKKDVERKRIARAKKKSDMTNEELAHIREADRSRQKRRRMNLSTQEKEMIKIRDRKAKQKKRNSLTQVEKDKANVKLLIQIRKYRLLQSEKSKSIARYKAKLGMRVLRKEGPIMEFSERIKKHIWAVKWRKFLACNPNIRELEKKRIANK